MPSGDAGVDLEGDLHVADDVRIDGLDEQFVVAGGAFPTGGGGSRRRRGSGSLARGNQSQVDGRRALRAGGDDDRAGGELLSVNSMPFPVVASCARKVAPAAWAAVLMLLMTSPTVVSPAMLTGTWTAGRRH